MQSGQSGNMEAFEPFLAPHDGAAETIRAVLEPTLATLGLELVQLFFVRGAHKDTVRIFVDRRLGAEPRVSMTDLEKANRLVSDVLDVEDQQRRLFPHAYDLEVGSPGVDRPLTKRSHFRFVVGERVKVKTKVPVAQSRSLTGTLVSADDERIELRLDGQRETDAPVQVAINDIQSAHTIFVFAAPAKPGQRATPPRGPQGPRTDAQGPQERSQDGARPAADRSRSPGTDEQTASRGARRPRGAS